MTTKRTEKSEEFRIAIVGAGPSGFYAAESLLRADTPIAVDLYDKLPVPYGLVRYGVAPDHPKLKSVTAVFDRICQMDGFRFIGNVEIGVDVATAELQHYYHAVIYAYGMGKGRQLNIRGEDTPGCFTAHEFVAWYNGHPEYRDLPVDLSHECAIVIGQGNVALDVARILAKSPDELKSTDIAEHALQTLISSRIRTIRVIGRRGPAQVQCVSKELREFGSIDNCMPYVASADLDLSKVCEAELSDSSRADAAVCLELFREYSTKESEQRLDSRQCIFEFQWIPIEIIGDSANKSIKLQKTLLSGDAFSQVAVLSEQTRTVDCGLVISSVGYVAEALNPLQLDKSGSRLHNEDGRLKADDKNLDGQYATGWLKRGPQGTIGTNRADSVATVSALLSDLPHKVPVKAPIDELFERFSAQGVRPVSLSQWQKINAFEVQKGEASGRPRIKLTNIEEMLTIANA